MGSLSLNSNFLYPPNQVARSVVVYGKHRGGCCYLQRKGLDVAAAAAAAGHHVVSGLMRFPHVSVLACHRHHDLRPKAKIATSALIMEQDKFEENRGIINGNGIGIVNYFRGKTLLITGATGFLAKVLVEKILRSMPEVDKIYILLRAENEEAAIQKLENEIVNCELFKSIKQKYGEAYEGFMLSKLIPLVGDVAKPDFGLRKEVVGQITNEIDLLISSAATTAFNERYDVALDINTLGPSRMMNFAKQCKNIKLVAHFSTAYVAAGRDEEGIIMEKPLSMVDHNIPPIQDELKLVSNFKQTLDLDNVAMEKTMKELGLERAQKYGWANTYSFTKAMGEMLVDNTRSAGPQVPVVILRPSIVESTYSDPFSGWIQGNRMMDPIISWYGKGRISGFLVNPDVVIDVVPVDMVVNASLAAIAKHGINDQYHRKLINHVYQIGSSTINPLVMRDLTDTFYQHFKSFPSLDSKGNVIQVARFKHFPTMESFVANLREAAIERRGKMSAASTTNSTAYKMSLRLDTVCNQIVEQAEYMAALYEPYTLSHNGRFDAGNMRHLMECMSREENDMFGFDLKSIDWENYFVNSHIPGLRRHVMKDNPSLLDSLKK